MSFRKRLLAGEFVVLAEMDTPKGVDISDLINNARRIKGSVDAVVVPDMDKDAMRISALGGGVLMQQQGLEAIIRVCFRDRNRVALQGEILSAHVLGIQNLIVVPGEDVSLGDHIETKTVNDLDEIGLLKAVQSLEDGVDMAGFDLKGAPDFTVGCTIAPYADEEEMKREIEFAEKKILAGAEFVITPPVYDIDWFAKFMEGAGGLGVPIIPTVFLLKSVGIARYISINEPSAHLPEGLITRIRTSSDRTTECVKIAGETIKNLKGISQGVQIDALGWEHIIPSILENAGL